jgi:hypothetical protein
MSEESDHSLAQGDEAQSNVGRGRLPWVVAGLGIVGLGFGVWLVAGHGGSSGGGAASPPLQTVARARALSAVSACLLTDAGGVTHSPASNVWAGIRAAADETESRASFLPVPEARTSEPARAAQPDKQARAGSRPTPGGRTPEPKRATGVCQIFCVSAAG